MFNEILAEREWKKNLRINRAAILFWFEIGALANVT